MSIHKIKKIKIVLLFFIIISSFYACKNNSSKEETKINSPYFSPLLTNKNTSVFRGIDFNSSAENIKQTENAKLYEATSDHLFYELDFPNDTSQFIEYANIQYFLNPKNKLDIITVDVFLNDTIQEMTLKIDLLNYFNSKFKKIRNDDGTFPMWETTFEDSDLQYTLTSY